MTFPVLHRVVMGHDENGNANVVPDSPLSTVRELANIPGTVFHEVWNTVGTPAIVDNGADPTVSKLEMSAPAAGTRIRFADIPPDGEDFLTHGAESMKAAFSEVGDVAASTVKEDSPHPLMHCTESFDYGIVIEGTMTLVLDNGEVELRPGSVVVQRGTNHAWANRSGKACRMLFILIDATCDPKIAPALENK